MKSELRLEHEAALRFCSTALAAAGADVAVATLTARGLCLTSMRGIDSHGIRLLPHYVAGLEGGRLNGRPNYRFEQTAASTGVLDADHTLGHAAGMVSTRHAIELARTSGVGLVVARNSSHCGMLAYYALEACRHRMIGLAATHATARLRSARGVRPFFGNNPLCIAAPMGLEGPFCFDAAMSAITMNEVRRQRDIGGHLPDGVAADGMGAPTRDPTTAMQLLPIGDYKGFGLAMAVDVLCALMASMPAGPDVSDMFAGSYATPRRLGQVFGAVRIDAFLDPELFERQLGEIAERLRAEPSSDQSMPVLVPGDPEKQVERERTRFGIPISASDFERLVQLSAKLGVDPPQAEAKEDSE